MDGKRWTTTVLSCAEPEVAAAFWAGLLGGQVEQITGDFYVVGHGTAWLATQRSKKTVPATWPEGDRPVSVHLDICVADLQQAVLDAVELGATEEAQQPYPDLWRVMRAPGGHLFCLSNHIQDYLPVDPGANSGQGARRDDQAGHARVGRAARRSGTAPQR